MRSVSFGCSPAAELASSKDFPAVMCVDSSPTQRRPQYAGVVFPGLLLTLTSSRAT
ncbi:hypothetical protein D3C72_423390 [compost metagenome]